MIGKSMMQMMAFQGPTFTLQVPTHWFVSSTPQFQAVFLMPSDGIRLLRPSVTISLRPVLDDVTAAAVAASEMSYLREAHPDLQILDEFGFDDNGQKRFYRRFSWHDAENNLDILQSQSFVIEAGTLYVITTTSNGDPEIESIFADMLESFKFTG
jgi:hypothetical protein